MHISYRAFTIERLLALISAGIIALIPFHAFLTVWLSQLVGHYFLLRLWKEGLLIVLAAGAVWLVAKEPKWRQRLRQDPLWWLLGVYGLLQLLWGIAALPLHNVSRLTLGYGWVSDTRYLLFFAVVTLLASRWRRFYTWWPRLLFWPAAIVIVVGLLQFFVLPYNVLIHFGYGSSTIFPYEDINNNLHYLRIMSTLRGANPLGAYLVVVLCLNAALLWDRFKRSAGINSRSGYRVDALLVGTMGAAFVTLILSFSRSAWLGALIGIGWLGWSVLPAVWRRITLIIGSGTLLLVVLGVVALAHNTTFQNVVLHSQADSNAAATSDHGHVSALEYGVHDIIHEPLGRGPGTAGPASVYNFGHPVRIAEDYFIQIGQEVGWLGLGLFIAINVLVARRLWQQRKDPLSLGLLAALLGIIIVNILSHAWADDTLAYLWWGLAGLAYSKHEPR